MIHNYSRELRIETNELRDLQSELPSARHPLSTVSHVGTILLVEPNEDEIYLLGKGLQRAGVMQNVQAARNGREAMYYLRKCHGPNGETTSGLPGLVLLDTKLPDMDGTDVLRWMRAAPALRELKVYMIGDSRMDLEIARAQGDVANGYWIKPLNMAEYCEFAGRIKARLEQGTPVGS